MLNTAFNDSRQYISYENFVMFKNTRKIRRKYAFGKLTRSYNF